MKVYNYYASNRIQELENEIKRAEKEIALIDLIKFKTKKDGSDFVNPKDRIAFDNTTREPKSKYSDAFIYKDAEGNIYSVNYDRWGHLTIYGHSVNYSFYKNGSSAEMMQELQNDRANKIDYINKCKNKIENMPKLIAELEKLNNYGFDYYEIRELLR